MQATKLRSSLKRQHHRKDEDEDENEDEDEDEDEDEGHKVPLSFSLR